MFDAVDRLHKLERMHRSIATLERGTKPSTARQPYNSSLAGPMCWQSAHVVARASYLPYAKQDEQIFSFLIGEDLILY